jgi:hypothetical protein
MSGVNKIVTSVSALTDNIVMPNINNVVCIDTENSRIGVGTSSPNYDIDVSGTINTNFLRLGTNAIISISNDYIFTSTSINISGEISGNSLRTNSINTSTLDTVNLACSSIFYVNRIRPYNPANLSISGNIIMDGSLALLNRAKLFVNNINPLLGNDISINSNVIIDGSLNIKGIVSSSNGIITTSDDRLKHNEEVITNALTTIRQLSPQIYQKTANFKDLHYRGALDEPFITEAGLIAQEVENIDELKFSVISGNEQTPYSLNYNNIFVYTLAGLKELDAQVQIINESLSKNENFIKNEGSNDLVTIVNNKIELIEQLTKKMELLENRLANIERSF